MDNIRESETGAQLSQRVAVWQDAHIILPFASSGEGMKVPSTLRNEVPADKSR